MEFWHRMVVRPERAAVWATALLMSWGFLVLSGIRPGLVDDTLITFQYARVLAETGIATWHPDLPIVDGYTSLGHVLMLSLGLVVGIDVFAANSAIGFGAMVLIVLLYMRQTAELAPGPRLLGLAVITTNATFVFWVAAGLDAAPYAAAVFWAYIRFARAQESGAFGPGTVLALVVLALMRPEGTIIALALAAFFVATRLCGLAPRSPAGCGWAGVLVAVIGLVIGWRLATYGHPFPNTYYAKTSASVWLEVEAGAAYILRWVLTAGGFLVMASPLALVLGSGAWVRALFVAGLCALPLVSGGDSHPAFRFLLPIIPLIALDMAWLLSRAQSHGKPVKLVTTTLLCAYLAFQVAPVFQPEKSIRVIGTGVQRILAGTWPLRTLAHDVDRQKAARTARDFGSLFTAGATIAATDVGALAYYSGRPILDVFGLNHAAIAHLPKPTGAANLWGIPRLDVLLAEKVDVVHLWFPIPEGWTWKEIADGTRGCTGSARAKAGQLGHAEDALAEEYVCVSYRSATHEGLVHNFLMRRETARQTLIDPSRAEFSSCVRQVRAACPQ